MIIPTIEPIAAAITPTPQARTRAIAPSIIAPAARTPAPSLAEAWKPKPHKP